MCLCIYIYIYIEFVTVQCLVFKKCYSLSGADVCVHVCVVVAKTVTPTKYTEAETFACFRFRRPKAGSESGGRSFQTLLL